MRPFLALFLFILLAQVSYAATVHGAAYDSSYKLIKDVRFEINTTPAQSHISKNGLYFFFVPLGTYEIIAEKSYLGEIIYTSTKTVIVEKDGEFNIDLIMKRVSDTVIPAEESDNPFLAALRDSYKELIVLIIIIIAVIFLIFHLRRRRKKADEHTSAMSVQKKEPAPVAAESISAAPENPSPEKKEEKKETSSDLNSILNIIDQEGGRTTQKAIRKEIPLSEAKISLMISELEEQGKIQKIKKGRGN